MYTICQIKLGTQKKKTANISYQRTRQEMPRHDMTFIIVSSCSQCCDLLFGIRRGNPDALSNFFTLETPLKVHVYGNLQKFDLGC